MAYQAGSLEEAYQTARQAAKIANADGHLAEAAGAIRTMSIVLMDQGRLPRAFKTMKCALALHTQTHNRAEMIEDVLALVLLFLRGQQTDVAARYLAQAQEWTEDHRQPHHHAKCKELESAVGEARDDHSDGPTP